MELEALGRCTSSGALCNPQEDREVLPGRCTLDEPVSEPGAKQISGAGAERICLRPAGTWTSKMRKMTAHIPNTLQFLGMKAIVLALLEV